MDFERGVVISSDGQPISYAKVGVGPAIVVCHGALTTADHWYGFATAIADSYTVYVYDRRGRAGSMDGDRLYAFEREVDDLAAMVAHAGEGCAVFGHSFGGGVSLSFGLRGDFQGMLVLYEPMHSTRSAISRGLRPELEALVASGDLEQALRFALERIVAMSPAEIEGLLETPLWSELVKMVSLFPRELIGLDNLVLDLRYDASFGARVRLLLGDMSPREPHAIACAEIVERMPGVKLHPLHGQAHVAHLLDPQGLARAVRSIL